MNNKVNKMSQTEEENDKKTSRIKFWRELKEYLLPDFVPVDSKKEHPGSFVKFKRKGNVVHAARYDLRIVAEAKGGGIQVELCLDFKLRKAFYENLLQYREEINKDFGGADSLSWDCSEKENPEALYKITTPYHQCDPYNEAEWDSIFESFKDSLEKLDKVMFRHLEKIENEMSGSAPKKTSIVGGSVAFVVILVALYILFF